MSANAPGSYQLSAPNEGAPESSVVVAAPAQQPVEASTSAQFRWTFGATSSLATPDLALLPPSRQNPSA